uniref:ShKT domain-containing protein n=1 Tax=Panagrellus redivivus TaxID=6233 RepID=A0A7E4VNU5_PANRE
MLRDYCPIMCGVCRPQRRKRPKVSNVTVSAVLPFTSTESSQTTVDNQQFMLTSALPSVTFQNLAMTYNNSVLETKADSPMSMHQDVQAPTASNYDGKKETFSFTTGKPDQPTPPTERPRAISIFNSGRSQQTSPFKDIEPATIPLITSFKNQIINPEQRVSPYPRSQPPEAQPLTDPSKTKKAEIRYRPYPIDYVDDSMYSEGPPLDIPTDNYGNYGRPYPNPHVPAYMHNHPLPIAPPYVDTSGPYVQGFAPQMSNYRNAPRPKRRRIQQKPNPRHGIPIDYDMPAPTVDDIMDFASTSEDTLPIPVDTELIEEAKRGGLPSPLAIADLITLLGCRDRDPIICSKVTEESCRARPGFYLKLCPVKCRNCNGLVCMDSNKINCAEMQSRGGCRLAMAQEYCPKTCMKCPTPPFIAEQQSPCRDELDTCEQLAESGVCDHPFSRPTLRVYCAKSCGFCKASQYYMNEYTSQNQPSSFKRFKSP